MSLEHNYPRVFDLQDVDMNANLDNLVTVTVHNSGERHTNTFNTPEPFPVKPTAPREFTPLPPKPPTERTQYIDWRAKQAANKGLSSLNTFRNAI